MFCNDTEIEELDISNNFLLKKLYCYETNIKKLDVSKNLQLTELFCNDTEIEELDISNNLYLAKYNFGDNISKITFPGNYEVSIIQSLGGTLKIKEYDIVTNSITIEATSDSGYSFINLNGIPENNQISENYIHFSIESNLNISGEFAKIDLTDLKIEGIDIFPTFSQNVEEYSAVVEYETDKVVISAVSTNHNCIIQGIGEKELQVGENSFKILVYGSDYVLNKEYKINILKKAKITTDDTIEEGIMENEDIAISDGELSDAELDETPKTGNINKFYVAMTVMSVLIILNISDKVKRK